MPKNVNSASRLVSLIKSIPAYADNTPTIDVWTALFNVEEQSTKKRGLVVSERLAAANRELELVKAEMVAKNFSEELYSPAISHLEEAFSTMVLHTSWAQPRQYFTKDAMIAMAFCGEIIDNEEDLISAEDLTEILNSVQDLELCLVDTALPLRLKALIQHHIDLIRKSIAEYPIVGARGLRQAARTGLGEIIEVQEEIRANPDAKEIAKLGAVWKRVNTAADLALKADKLAQLGHKAWQMVEGFLPT